MKTSIKYISPHWYLGCDQACRECYIGTLRSTITTPMEERIRAIDAFMPYKPEQFFIVGGNPTLDPFIEETAAALKSRGIAVCVLSNSWSMPKVADKRKFLSSLDDRAATFFGADAAMHDGLNGCPGSFQRLKDNVGKWSAQGYSFVPVINIMPGNKDHIYDIIKRLREFVKFERVWTQRIMPYGNALGNDDMYLKLDDLNPIFEQLARAKADFKLEEVAWNMTAPTCLVASEYRELNDPMFYGVSMWGLDHKGRLFANSFEVGSPELALFGGAPVWEVPGDLNAAIAAEAHIQQLNDKKYLPPECAKCPHYDNCFGGYPVRGADGAFVADPILCSLRQRAK
ncbi:MAG: radical SAM protein [Alphaproteobacteria bacterium]|nr:radical SAM protein [Alphaproteobacteria bacterium]